ncbi:hypothetical protein [Salimicrobium humidisoli]|uniref:Uncharacterized protein n=1 Tax=Salimicrobium humidisoli TaxID=2029857 RepID=A0ABX4HTQ1_9BACI|nr:hypothetical protein [Salimicrobium humidisoli]PBB06453.1 hypothetical protein CKW00_03755 [Salimicrobium humidisoli]
MKVLISNLIGVKIDKSYPWKDTLFINSGIATFGDAEYEKSKATISIEKCKTLSSDDCRDIGEGMLIGNNVFVDMKYGVRIERESNNHITLKVVQECNEWLVICIQLLLLELNCTLVHAAALEKDGEVLLLPSWGGVGKTATVMRMVKEGEWKLLGDDLVIVKNNEIHPFLKPFVIYPYHKNLFPQVFQSNKRNIITNSNLNKLLSSGIPYAKKIMRPIPGLLAFARKHNPQSMRVSPLELFDNKEISNGGELKKVIWLERIVGNEVNYYEKEIESLVSKVVSVSILELFAGRINCVYALNGAGIFDYQKTHIKMYDLITSSFKRTENFELDIPTSISIDDVGEIVLKHIVSDKSNDDSGSRMIEI